MVFRSRRGRRTYTEIRDDEHPIIVISAADIIAILKKHGIPDAAAVLAWLEQEFPKT